MSRKVDGKHSSRTDKHSEKARIKRRWHWGTFGHFLTIFFTFILAIVVLVVMVLWQFFRGPSQAASDLGVQTLHQSSALKFVPYLFLFDHTTEALERGETLSAEGETDASLVTVAFRGKSDTPAENQDGQNTGTDEPADDTGEQFDENGIRIEEVTGGTYHGYMMIVRDPSRVSVGTCARQFSTQRSGKRVDEIMQDYGAIAGMNGGGFYDANGSGTGGQAEGLVISQGVFLNRASNGYAVVAGFDQDNILHVGTFSKDQAEKLGLRDAVAFGPALIVNGQPSLAADKGLNPRTAIGQRSDGAVLMLVIDGRQANSMGATLADVINVMLEFGAVNACNMDGGSSTIMYYGDKKINDGMTVSVSRRMPTAWIVK